MIFLLFLLFTAYFVYKVLLKKNPHHIIYTLLFLFAVYSLPSEIAEFLVIRVGGYMIKLQDIFLLITFVHLVVNKNSRTYIHRNLPIATIVLLIIVVNLLQLLNTWFSYGIESSFLRTELFGVLCLVLCLVNFNLLENNGSQIKFGILLNFFNVITLATAFLVSYYPELNQIDSDLYTAIGWQVLSGEGSMVFITVIAANVCLFSIYYFLFIQGRNTLHPSVILPVLLIASSSHRITYLALLLMFTIYFIRRLKSGFRFRLSKSGVVMFSIYSILSVAWIMFIPWDTFYLSESFSFYERLLSLGDSKNQTIVGRLFQYTYFFTEYLPGADGTTLLLGENYLPGSLRDPFYYYVVSPHNVVIDLVVATGVVGLSLVALLFLIVLISSQPLRHNLFILPLMLYLLTQLTDAAFSSYPISALFALHLSLVLSNKKGSTARYRVS
jgi:hypothetical protein